MKSIIQVLIAVVLLILLIRLSEPTKKPQNNPIPEGGTSILNDNPIEPSPQEEVFQFSSLLDLHNSVRKSPLTVDSELSKFAQKWAEHMERKVGLEHSDLEFPGNWSYKGENIAEGPESEEEVFNNWMSSKKHKRNIKNEEFTHIGMGKSGNLWCVCFGRSEIETVYWWEFWR